MRDPMTVAYEIRYPWKAYSRAEREARDSDFIKTYRASFITIWHVDPERDGSDDSCDWHNRKGTLNERERAVAEAVWDVEGLLDNKPHYPSSREHKAWQPLHGAIMHLLHKPSRTHWWQVHPRWHVWHWQIQVHPWQQVRRWLLTRCARCGGRFRYGESPVSHSWHSQKAGFLRGEKGMYHTDCSGQSVAAEAKAT